MVLDSKSLGIWSCRYKVGIPIINIPTLTLIESIIFNYRIKIVAEHSQNPPGIMSESNLCSDVFEGEDGHISK